MKWHISRACSRDKKWIHVPNFMRLYMYGKPKNLPDPIVSRLWSQSLVVASSRCIFPSWFIASVSYRLTEWTRHSWAPPDDRKWIFTNIWPTLIPVWPIFSLFLAAEPVLNILEVKYLVFLMNISSLRAVRESVQIYKVFASVVTFCEIIFVPRVCTLTQSCYV